MLQELAKFQAKLNSVQNELAKQRKNVTQGEKLIKGKEMLKEEEERIQTVEEKVEKAEKMATPIGDEKMSNEAIQEMDQYVSDAAASLATFFKTAEMHGKTAPP